MHLTGKSLWMVDEAWEQRCSSRNRGGMSCCSKGNILHVSTGGLRPLLCHRVQLGVYGEGLSLIQYIECINVGTAPLLVAPLRLGGDRNLGFLLWSSVWTKLRLYVNLPHLFYSVSESELLDRRQRRHPFIQDNLNSAICRCIKRKCLF